MSFSRETVLAVLFALPWIALPLVALLRQRRTVSLDAFDAGVSDPRPERVSVVLPARNEAVHIAACVESLRASAWPNLEIVVVNDGSTDGTSELARTASAGDARVRVVDAPDLPTGWFGKQWACHTGVQHVTGSLFLFTDADTRHAPDLIPRLVHARASRSADLMSVAGSQAMHSFWEHAIQPAVFALLLTRYGGTASIEGAKRSVDVIANGQCLMITRDAYTAIGGHEAVKGTVAEDLMLAQRTHAHGLRVSLVLGTRQITTHMYDGLGAIVRGWMKNVYAGGRLSMWGGSAGRLIFPVVLVSGPLTFVAPFLVAVVLLVRVAAGYDNPSGLALWSAVSSIAMLGFFGAMNAFARVSHWRILLVPLGMLAFAGICAAAVVRGQKVEWKNRTYRAA